MQTAGGDDLSLAERLTVTGTLYHLLTPDAVVLLHEVTLVNHLIIQEARVTCVDNLDLAHHLANDDLEVLVVDLHTLHTINVLCLVDDIILYSRRTLDSQNILRRDRTIRQRYTGAYVVALLYQDLLRQRDQVRLRFTEFAGDCQFALASFDLAEADLTVDLSHDSRVRRVTRLKELRYTRQTTGDITCSTERTGVGEQQVADLNLLAIVVYEHSLDRQVVRTEDITLLVNDIGGRHLGLILGIGDADLTHTCLLVGFALASYTFDHILVAQRTGLLDNQRSLVRIPLADECTLVVLLPRSDEQLGSVRDVERIEHDTCLLVLELKLVQTADNDHVTGIGGDSTQVLNIHYTRVRQRVRVLSRSATRQTT